MVCDRDQNRVDQLPLSRIWKPAAMKQEHGVGKRRLSHQRRHVVAVNPDGGFFRPHDCRSPVVHEERDYHRVPWAATCL
jgi:hypothetical protein